MKTILVTGANGQLGNSIRLLAGKYSGYNFLFTDVDTLDITDPAAVRAMVKENGVNYILNCAAYTAVDKAEDDEALCRRINTFAVGVLGKAAHEAGAKMIHVSTDYVFSGTNCRPYVETDATRPVSAYGRTKLAGEEILQEVCPDVVIIRTAWLYSEFGNNFVKTVLRLGKERVSLTGTINTMNGEFYTHLHMSAGNDKGEVFGGHLNRAVVSATCEMVVDVLDGTVDRQYDPVTGLNLFKF